MNRVAMIFLLLPSALISVRAADRLTREDVIAATCAPYSGPVSNGVDTKTLTGKVVCGYQGWFNCEGDGAGQGWFHWTRGPGAPSPTNIKVDLWPDVSELGPDEKCDTSLKFPDGKPAQVFSSFKKETVLRHFRWMRDAGIDGVFVQRFAGGLRGPHFLRQNNTVLASCREGANQNGRGYAVMYDLSGLGSNRIGEVIEDWKLLRTKMKIGDDNAYFRHRGRPVVAVWGIGFNDNRRYSLTECRQLIEFLKGDGCTVMVGVPTWWRDGKHDAVSDPALRDVIAAADIVSPWIVGRIRNTNDIANHAERGIKPDIAWCADHKLDYMPVVFPGFSWHNMHGGRLADVPRQRGEFLWSQVVAAKKAGAGMLYVAMFDEVDEGTAIFKCVNNPPSDNFVTYEGLPSDYYLRLAGAAAKMMRGEIPPDTPRPAP